MAWVLKSRRAPHSLLTPVLERLRDHSLSIFLLITGIGWVALYASMDSEAKWDKWSETLFQSGRRFLVSYC